MGLVPLSLTGYASGLRCITLERDTAFAALAERFLPPPSRSSIEICTGDYPELLPAALDRLSRVDCLYFDRTLDGTTLEHLFPQCLPAVHGETVCLMGGIRSSPARRRLWQQFCAHPKVTVSVDLYCCGLLFFRPGLHPHTYKSMIR